MRLVGLILVATALTPLTSWSCEPIVPLAYLLSSSSLAGSAILTNSLLWLVVAVTVKCVAFICFEKRLPWTQAALFMLLANVLSTIPGVLLAVFTSSGGGGGLLVALLLVFALGCMVQRRVARLTTTPQRLRISGGIALVAFVVFAFLSIALYGIAATVLDGGNYASYWVLKFLFVTLVAVSGIVLSAVLEECVIAELTRKRAGNLSFYTSVFRANYVTLGLILFVAALQILPKRLRSPHYITSWLEQLWTTIGLG